MKRAREIKRYKSLVINEIQDERSSMGAVNNIVITLYQ